MKLPPLIILIILGISVLSFKTEKFPGFKKIEKDFLKEYKEGKERWSNNRDEQILYFQKVIDSRLVDEEFIFRSRDDYYRLNSNSHGIRVWNDTVYYYKTNKDHTDAGWKNKLGGGIFPCEGPKDIDENRVANYYNKVLQYKDGKLIEVQRLGEVKSVWELPDGTIYISQPGLGIIKSEHVGHMIERIKKGS